MNVTAGTLKLAAGVANNIASSTPINLNNGATLDVTGLSGGAITLASGQTLAGSGSVAGGVVAASGSHVAPGIGTLTMGSLNMANGSIYDYQFNNTPANGLINVNTAGGLTINGGGFNLYNQGSNHGLSPRPAPTSCSNTPGRLAGLASLPCRCWIGCPAWLTNSPPRRAK